MAPPLGRKACRAGVRSVKPHHCHPEPDAMIGIAAIVIFIAVIGALNLYEFGRLD